VAEWPEEEDEGVGPHVSDGEGRAGPTEGQGPRGVGGGSGLTESQGSGGWAKNLSWAQFKK
jgi:hypothetical protein